MNYRHAYHAGNHADILKHAVLARALALMAAKPKPLFVLDAHAGPALHALDGREALKTGEWRSGLGKLYRGDGTPRPLSDEAEAILAPWRACVAAVNPRGLARYPGSAEIARRLLPAQGRLAANEFHPEDGGALEAALAHDVRVRVSRLDALTAVKSLLPPPERRGLTLIDPSYETPDEPQRAARLLTHGLKRFATGTFLLWYPLAKGDAAETIRRSIAAPKSFSAELIVKHPLPQGGLHGSGLILVNPPWPLENELPVLLPALAERLAQDEACAWRFAPAAQLPPFASPQP